MTTGQLKDLVVQQFKTVGLLHCLDIDDSKFEELPTFFEVSHLAAELSVTDASLVPVAASLADQLKADLAASHGIELEVVIRSKVLVGA